MKKAQIYYARMDEFWRKEQKLRSLEKFESLQDVDWQEIQPDKKYRHFVFTTAKGLHHYTDYEKFRGMVKCYGYDDIRSLVDGNLHFWNFIREEILQFKTSSVSL